MRIVTEETRRKMSESHRGKRPWRVGISINKGSKHPLWGKKHSAESILKMSKAHTGKKMHPNTKVALLKAITGENSKVWRGDNVGYRALHNWVEHYLGKPRKCEGCGNDNLSHRQYHWANKSRLYKRIITDWIRLCVKCHKAFDGTKNQLQIN